MFKKFLFVVALVVTAALGTLPAIAAQEPSMHEIYQAAQDGRFIEAQTMMDQVLKEHPNSAKAHYVQAELQAKQGLLSKADAELRTAERLQPGLAFAKPEAVDKLRAIIAAPRGSVQSKPGNQSVRPAQVNQAAPEKGLPWGLLLGGAGLVAAIVFATRFMRQRSAAAMAPAGGFGAAAYGASPGMQPQGFGRGPAGPMAAPAYGAAPAQGMAPTAGGGIGSGIMGGLATGAAVGAGIVAGQALMHHFTDGDKSNNVAPPPAGNNWSPEPANDMGGNDFGVNDGSSWDDGGSSSAGGDDWN